MGIDLTHDEMLDVFGEEYTAQHDEYAAEADQRWSGTDAIRANADQHSA